MSENQLDDPWGIAGSVKTSAATPAPVEDPWGINTPAAETPTASVEGQLFGWDGIELTQPDVGPQDAEDSWWARQMGELELGDLGDFAYSSLSESIGALNQKLARTAQSIVGGMQYDPGMQIVSSALDFSENVEEYRQEQSDLTQAAREEQSRVYRDAKPGFLGEAVLQAAGSVAATTPGLVGGIVSGGSIPAALMPIYLTTAPRSEQEALDRGVDPLLAATKGTWDGLTEIALEASPLKALLTSGTVRARFINFLAREVPTELATTTLQKFGERYIENPDQAYGEFLNELQDELIMTAVSTPLSAGAQLGVAESLRASAPVVAEGTVRAGTKVGEVLREATTQLSEIRAAAREVGGPSTPFSDEINIALDELRASGEREAELATFMQESLRELMDRAPEDGPRIPTTRQFEESVDMPFGQEALDQFETATGERATAKSFEPGQTMFRVEDQPKTQADREFLESVKPAIEKIWAAFEPTKPLMVTFKEDIRGMFGGIVFGSAQQTYVYEQAATMNRTPEIGTAYKLQIALDNIRKVQKDNKSGLDAEHLGIIAHEIGHAALADSIRQLPEKVKLALVSEFHASVEAIRNSQDPSMRSFMARVASSPADFFSRFFNRTDRIGPDWAASNQYEYRFAEWLATKMDRASSQPGELQDILKEFFPNVAEEQRRGWERMQKIAPGESLPTEAFDLFLERSLRVGERRRVAETAERARLQVIEGLRELANQPPEAVVRSRFGNIMERVRAGRVAAGVSATEQGKTVATEKTTFESPEAVEERPKTNWRDRRTRKKFEQLARKKQQEVDQYSWYVRLLGHLTHLARDNKHIEPLQRYTQVVRDAWQTKMRWATRGSEVVRDYLNLNSTQQRDIGLLMVEAEIRSEELGRVLSANEIQEIIKSEGLKLNAQSLAVADNMWQMYRDASFEMERRAIEAIQRQDLNETEQTRLIARVRKDFSDMRKRNYYPHTRFGKYVVSVRVPDDGKTIEFGGQTFGPGEIVLFETFESRRMRAEGKKMLLRELPKGVDVTESLLTESQFTLQGLPPVLQNLLAKELDLDADQAAELERLALRMSPAQGFRKRFIRRKNVLGYSEDAGRVFGEYFSRFSNFLQSLDLKERGELAAEDIRRSGMSQQDSTKRMEIYEHVRRHLEYMLNPGNELANLRAIGFLWYLGFSPKAAMINLSQLPLVSYPALAARSSDAAALGELGKAMKDTARIFKSGGKSLSIEEDMMIEALKQSGILEESAASELAGISEGSFLQRMTAGKGNTEFSRRSTQFLRMAAHWGTVPFQAAEIFNRYTTALASYRIALRGGKTHEESVQFAQEMVETTQFEYARWNRPEMFRGKKSAAFLFFQYLTNMLDFAGNDKGRVRYMLMLFGFAGLSGLPFAENIMQIWDFLATKFKTMLGIDSPKTQSRVWLMEQFAEAAEYLDDWGVPEQYIPSEETLMYGASRATPFDLHASLSMGDIIPGLSQMVRGGDPQDNLGAGLIDAAGAAANMPIQMLIALGSDEPDSWKRWEKAMPTAMRGLSQAYRWARRGEETDYAGNRVADFDLNNPAHMQEIVGRALGFTSTRVNTERNNRYIASDAVRFYEGRKRAILAKWAFALDVDDSELLEEVMEAKDRYNESVPDATLKIGPETVKNSIGNRRTREAQASAGVYANKGGRLLYREILDALEGRSEDETPATPDASN